jgi:hypothetical protein
MQMLFIHGIIIKLYHKFMFIAICYFTQNLTNVMLLLWPLVEIWDSYTIRESVMERHDKGQGNSFKLQPPEALFYT